MFSFFSTNHATHREHVQAVFQRLQDAGLTLKGQKCHIGMSQVSYLGHVFSSAGMTPDQQKIEAIQDWPVPHDVHAVRQFIGLASYYRRYIKDFAEIAAPLHRLTQKGETFQWGDECSKSFNRLKASLSGAPVLAFPVFGKDASAFVVQTDASAIGLGAVLEQNGKVIAYASRVLTKPEKNYSVIQRECLAIIFALKQFRHYLLGRPFTLLTDHAPLQWLSSQKMEGLLSRWALVLQEYDFQIKYQKGTHNVAADALSRRYLIGHCALTSLVQDGGERIRDAQQQDPTLKAIYNTLANRQQEPDGPEWNSQPLKQYRQLWHQLKLVQGVIIREYVPGPTEDHKLVPLYPAALQKEALHRNHDIPTAGHQGADKTLQRLRQEAYWVNMASDVHRHCESCTTCQQARSARPVKAPLQSVPIGQPWEMIAIDILEIPMSTQYNKYLLVVQDYFTKWATAIPIPDQTAAVITREMVKLFSIFGVPSIIHSDQGRNFESTLFRATLDAFGIEKSQTTAYHPQGDGMVERMNRSLLQLLRAYVSDEAEWERYLPLVLYAYCSAVHTSTGISPFELMFGRPPKESEIALSTRAFDPESYQGALRSKLAELQDFVEAKLADSARKQTEQYNKSAKQRSFQPRDTVWLSVPTARKLEPKWEGQWTISRRKSALTFEIKDGRRTRVVHINRLKKRLQPDLTTPRERACRTLDCTSNRSYYRSRESAIPNS